MPTTLRLVLVMAIAALVIAACGGGDLTRDAHPTTLAGTTWRVVAINGQAMVPGVEPTAQFAENELQGSSGCNSYGGDYTYEPSTGAISFGELSTTLMLCDGPAGAAETAFSQAINQAQSASIDPEGRLVLTGPGGEIVLVVAAVGG